MPCRHIQKVLFEWCRVRQSATEGGTHLQHNEAPCKSLPEQLRCCERTAAASSDDRDLTTAIGGMPLSLKIASIAVNGLRASTVALMSQRPLLSVSVDPSATRHSSAR
jgi:hypothetical protein